MGNIQDMDSPHTLSFVKQAPASWRIYCTSVNYSKCKLIFKTPGIDVELEDEKYRHTSEAGMLISWHDVSDAI